MQALGTRNQNIAQRAGAAGPHRGHGQKNGAGQDGGKRKRVEVDYTSTKRTHPGVMYGCIASQQLVQDFPMFYVAGIKSEFYRNNSFYAPTYIKLYEAVVRGVPLPGVQRLRTARKRADTAADLKPHDDFQAEHEWVHSVWKVGYDAKRADRKRRKTETYERPVGGLGLNIAENDNLHVPHEVGEVSIKIECGCCFDDECSFVTMIQCADAHLFCRDCVRAQAGAAVGSRQKDILCMDSSGCKQPFPVPELQKCLEPRTFDLWQKIVQAEDIAAAQLEGLEHCPNCDFCMIFEVGIDVAPVLTCLRSDCRLVSCRKCKKKDHTGKACEEAEDAKLQKEHAVEEAMTNALVRACPGCKMPFIKADGCNKIVCQNVHCRMISCYLCRSPINLQNPYDHFDRNVVYGGMLCRLWDPNHGDSRARHQAEVAAAEQVARKQIQAIR